MSERPITFNDKLVRAILDGRKTQHRLPVKMDGIDFRGAGGPDGPDWNDPSCWGYENEDGNEWALAPGELVDFVIPSPFGRVGDRLWVKETWAPMDGEGGQVPAIYRADFLHDRPERWTWRPSIHMPRWASRITLVVTRKWVERVQEISESDVLAEGVPSRSIAKLREWFHRDDAPGLAFRELWDSIYAAKGFGWDANPWVFACEFERINT